MLRIGRQRRKPAPRPCSAGCGRPRLSGPTRKTCGAELCVEKWRKMSGARHMERLRQLAHESGVCYRCLERRAVPSRASCRECLLKQRMESAGRRERNRVEEEAALELACAQIEMERATIIARLQELQLSQPSLRKRRHLNERYEIIEP